MEGNELVPQEHTILVSITRHERLASDFNALLLEGEIRFESALKAQTSVTLVLVHALPFLVSGGNHSLLEGIPRLLAPISILDVPVVGCEQCIGAHGGIRRLERATVHLLDACKTAINDIEQLVDLLVRQFRLSLNVLE